MTIFAVPVMLAASAIQATEWQTLASIQAAASNYVRSQFGSEAEVAINSRTLDNRLRLIRCPTPLRADAPKGFRAGRGTVQVRCEGPKPWKLFVPVMLTRQIPVVVARRALAAGTVIGPSDLAVEKRSESLLPMDFLTDPEGLDGLTTRRAIPAGGALTSRLVQAERLVRRGQRVALVTSAGGVFVKSDGIAMADAGRHQRLAVKTRAGRVVEGIVRNADTVEIDH
jgi:flagella basal body P-ring formation protein FlgA